jgi:phosphoadenosine phosphosulfate reductase
MRGALAGAEVWITGITRTQSATRAETPLIGWDWQFQLLKISPLAKWDRRRVWEYVQAHDVPYNPLHAQGYPSIGCTHCTKPVAGASVTEYTRLGRWNSSDKTECGLHSNGSGI